jgi:hypothetical protein
MIKKFLAALRHLGRPITVLAAATGLAGCVYSTAPILTGGTPPFGKEAHFQFYGLTEHGAREPQQARYRWDGSRYVFVDGDYKDTGAFTMQPLAGRDFIVQSINAKTDKPVDYALARRLAAGVYLVVAIDEDDADAATRDKFCAKKTSCRIETREALTAFARATAAKPHERGGLALLLAAEKR